MPTDFDPTQLLEAGFALECSKYADTPLRRGDQLLHMDAAGHVLIARAPIKKRDA
jgi:hypothetical protein